MNDVKLFRQAWNAVFYLIGQGLDYKSLSNYVLIFPGAANKVWHVTPDVWRKSGRSSRVTVGFSGRAGGIQGANRTTSFKSYPIVSWLSPCFFGYFWSIIIVVSELVLFVEYIWFWLNLRWFYAKNGMPCVRWYGMRIYSLTVLLGWTWDVNECR